ncbi:SEC-C metal-binding domain-containing protein [Magnetofaba australis]|uniref:SEC-C metal-binding domain-containing protein n=1 Tax=Magnetofaba australis TaxID=1472297 RepID=UPI0023B9C95A|nr:SEC-C metal-binding domain-containing protein [Magnetofaba australis]
MAELSTWASFREDQEYEFDPPFGFEDDDEFFPAPHVNPFRDIGRNDPCPCGSGKKFKKCCLN